MKKSNYFKGALLQVSFVATILLIASCDNNQRAEDTKVIAEERNEAKFDNDDQEDDAEFLVNAAEINLEKIQLAQLAQKNGTSADVKELGRMMEQAHTKSLNDLTALARSKNITIPTSVTDDARDAYDNLNKKSGIDFDKAYADRMISGHKDAINAFEKASTKANDIDIKNWAIATLPVLRTHLNYSLEYQKKNDKR